jgi:hypothetical protein
MPSYHSGKGISVTDLWMPGVNSGQQQECRINQNKLLRHRLILMRFITISVISSPRLSLFQFLLFLPEFILLSFKGKEHAE